MGLKNKFLVVIFQLLVISCLLYSCKKRTSKFDDYQVFRYNQHANINTLDPAFSKDYGLLMTDGPLHDLFARVVIVLDEEGTVTYTELVPDIVQEPNYDAALAAL